MWVNGNLAGGAPAAKRSPTPRKTKNPQAEEQQSGESSRWGEKKPQRKPTREGKRRETREQNRKHREEQEARREGRAVHWGDETKTKHTGVKKTRSKAATTMQQTNTAAAKHPQRDGPRRIKSAGDGLPGNTGEGRPLHQNTKRQRNGSDQTQAACSPARAARSRRSAVPGTALLGERRFASTRCRLGKAPAGHPQEAHVPAFKHFSFLAHVRLRALLRTPTITSWNWEV